MPEGPPEKRSVLESKEGEVRPPKYRTIEDIVLEKHEDGSKTHRVIECNGHVHRLCVDRIFYDEEGAITFVDELSREEQGPCDGKHS